tara:strand:- start:1 stop:207 length:207 start_codon:yes stop_codon:yes gene_type:complete
MLVASEFERLRPLVRKEQGFELGHLDVPAVVCVDQGEDLVRSRVGVRLGLGLAVVRVNQGEALGELYE